MPIDDLPSGEDEERDNVIDVNLQDDDSGSAVTCKRSEAATLLMSMMCLVLLVP